MLLSLNSSSSNGRSVGRCGPLGGGSMKRERNRSSHAAMLIGQPVKRGYGLGIAQHSLDLLAESELKVVAQVTLSVEQCLVGQGAGRRDLTFAQAGRKNEDPKDAPAPLVATELPTPPVAPPPALQPVDEAAKMATKLLAVAVANEFANLVEACGLGHC
mgnify:CR=1 FL=1